MKNKCHLFRRMSSRSNARNARRVGKARFYFSLELIREERARTRFQFYLFNLSNYFMTKRNEIMNGLGSGTFHAALIKSRDAYKSRTRESSHLLCFRRRRGRRRRPSIRYRCEGKKGNWPRNRIAFLYSLTLFLNEMRYPRGWIFNIRRLS